MVTDPAVSGFCALQHLIEERRRTQKADEEEALGSLPMPTKHVFMASLVVAFVVLWALDYHGAPQRVVTGTIRESEAGEWLSVATHTTNPRGLPIALRNTTGYEGSPAAIKPGARVTIWYRSVGERRFVADKVRVLPD